MNTNARILIDKSRKRCLLRLVARVMLPKLHLVHHLGLTAMGNAINANNADAVERLTNPFVRIAMQSHLLNQFLVRYNSHITGIDLAEFDRDIERFLVFFPKIYDHEWFFQSYLLPDVS